MFAAPAVLSRVRAGLGRAGAGPSRALPARWLCDAADGEKARLEAFLRSASRPKMGEARAKQSAGQKALDLARHLGAMEGITLDQLAAMGTIELKKLGLEPQERKRLLRHTYKLRTGWTPPPEGTEERPHAWRLWTRPAAPPGQEGDARASARREEASREASNS